MARSLAQDSLAGNLWVSSNVSGCKLLLLSANMSEGIR